MACQSSRTRPLTLAAIGSTSKGYHRPTEGWPFMDTIEHPYECLMCGEILWTDACIQEHVGRHSYEPSPTATDQNQHKQTTSSSLNTKTTRARADKPQPPTRDGPISHSEPPSDIDAGRPVRTKLYTGGMTLTLLHRDKHKDNPVCGKTDQLVKSSSRQADGERLDAKSKYSTASVASTRTSDCKVLYEELFTESPCLDLILQQVDFYGNDVVRLVIKIDADRYEHAVHDAVNIRVMRPKLAWKWTQCGTFVNYDEWKLAGNMYHIELSADKLRKRAKLSLDESALFVAEYLSGRTGYTILAKSKEFYVHPALPETDTSNRATNSNTHKNDEEDIDVETFENVSAALKELVDQPQRLSGNAAVVNVSTTSGSHVDGVTLTRADEVNAKRLVSDQCKTSECKSPACEHAMAKLNTRIIELEQERLQLTLVLNNIFHTAAAAQTRVSTALSTATDTALSGSSSQSSLSSRAPALWWQ